MYGISEGINPMISCPKACFQGQLIIGFIPSNAREEAKLPTYAYPVQGEKISYAYPVHGEKISYAYPVHGALIPSNTREEATLPTYAYPVQGEMISYAYPVREQN